MDIATAHRQALESTRKFVGSVRPDQLAAPTVNEGWDVAELLSHIVYGNRWVPPLVSGQSIEEVGDRLEGDQLGNDPLAAYDASAEPAAAAFEAPGALDAQCAVSYGPVPGSVYAGHRFIDVLIHGWDLAVATGQDPTLDPALVEMCFEVIEPQMDMVRGSGVFGSEVEVAADADRQTRLLAVLGRRVPPPGR
jgi:uncharacterized protein (TIGR03086 family)